MYPCISFFFFWRMPHPRIHAAYEAGCSINVDIPIIVSSMETWGVKENKENRQSRIWWLAAYWLLYWS